MLVWRWYNRGLGTVCILLSTAEGVFLHRYIIINAYTNTIPKNIKNLLRFIDSLGSKACTISSPLGKKKLKEKKRHAPGYTTYALQKRKTSNKCWQYRFKKLIELTTQQSLILPCWIQQSHKHFHSLFFLVPGFHIDSLAMQLSWKHVLVVFANVPLLQKNAFFDVTV